MRYFRKVRNFRFWLLWLFIISKRSGSIFYIRCIVQAIQLDLSFVFKCNPFPFFKVFYEAFGILYQHPCFFRPKRGVCTRARIYLTRRIRSRPVIKPTFGLPYTNHRSRRSIALFKFQVKSLCTVF